MKMTLLLVAKIDDNTFQFGRAGDFKPMTSGHMPIGWLNNDLIISKLIRSWFHEWLMCTPKNTKLLIVENCLLDLKTKKRLCDIIFKRVKVHSLIFIPDLIMSCIGAGTNNALIIDVGWCNSIIVPIMDWRILDNYMGITKRSTNSFLNIINKKYEVNGNILLKSINCYTKETLKYENVELTWDAQLSLLKEVIGSNLNNQTFFDNDEYPLVQLFIKIVNKLSNDLRNNVLSNIIISGPFSEINGVKKVILEELKVLYPGVRLIHSLGPWCGGSIYASQVATRDQEKMEINIDKYKECRQIPDWHLQRFI